MTTYLYCFRDGTAYFGPRVPDGALPIAKQTDFEAQVEKIMHESFRNSRGQDPDSEPMSWRDRMTARLRHGYEPGVLLVPGIPEARDAEEAYEALEKFREWCNK